VSVFRGLIFEKWLCSNHRLNSNLNKNLGDEAKLLAFRAAVDEHYRYHQFFGGMAVVLPILYVGWFNETWATHGTLFLILTFWGFVLIELALGFKASEEYRALVDRSNSILKG
jgi:hypothetical protein